MKAILFALGAGLLAALSQPPVSIPWVLILALPLLYRLWQSAERPGRAFAVGWFAGAGYFGATLIWIAEPFFVQPEIHGWMAPFAVAGMAGGMALFWGAGFWVAKRIGSTGWSAPFALTFCLVGMEWLRGNILSGFPWSLLGYAWVETPLMQLAADIGIYGVTLMTVMIGMILGEIWMAATIRRRLVLSGLVIALAAVWALRGEQRLAGAGDPTQSRPGIGPVIGLVQPNVAQRDKWQPELREAHIRDLLEKTRTLAEQGAQVIIWPEAATPYQIDKGPVLRAAIADALSPGGILLAGAVRFDGDAAFNSLIAVGSDAEVLGIYDKQHLVPFGEMLPMDSLLTSLGVRTMIALPGGFTPGDSEERIMALDGLAPFVPMICYETIFPAEIMRRAGVGEWMVQVTNDAWFGNWIGPYQHFAMARVRAIERGLPLARSANTGISAIIDGYGRPVARLTLNRDGIVKASLPPKATETLYSRHEDQPFGAIMILIALFSVLRVKRR